MPDRDDGLRRAIRSVAPHVSTDGVREAIHRRRWRHEVRRRIGSGFLTVAVVAGSIAGYAGLRRAFEPAEGSTGVIAFMRALRGCPEHPTVSGPEWDVFATAPDGGDEWNITDPRRGTADHAHNQLYPTFSPDGARVAWVDYYEDGLFVTDVATGATVRVVRDLAVADPAWSPDGTSILFTGGPTFEQGRKLELEEQLAVRPALFVVPASGGAATELVPNGAKATWSPDGRTIAFLRNDFGIVKQDQGAVSFDTGPARQSLWFVDADGTDPREIEFRPDDADWGVNQGAWSPDGRRLAAEVTFDGNHDIVVVDIETRSGTRLTDHPAVDASPAWSPDGSTIAFATGRWGSGSGRAEIATIEATGEHLERVTDNCWDDRSPTWVPNDSTIRSLETWKVPTPPPKPAGAIDLYGDGSFVCDVNELEADLIGRRMKVTSVWVYSPTIRDGEACPHSGHASRTLAVDTDGDERPDVTWGPLPCIEWCFPLAATDIGGDTREELFVYEGHLAQPVSARVGMFVVDPTARGADVLARASFPDGTETFEIVTEGSQILAGAYCRNGLFHVWRAPTHDAGATYRLTDRTYRLQGSRLMLDGVERATVTGSDRLPPDPAGNICGAPIELG
jgi:dipeptidyl aminopeptidase/acylaminoacyl peptidase